MVYKSPDAQRPIHDIGEMLKVGEYGNALQAASSGGHEKVVQMLQEQQLLTILRIKTLKRSIQTDV